VQRDGRNPAELKRNFVKELKKKTHLKCNSVIHTKSQQYVTTLEHNLEKSDVLIAQAKLKIYQDSDIKGKYVRTSKS
jgi:hypothetical protein